MISFCDPVDASVFITSLGTLCVCDFTRHKYVEVVDVQEIESVIALLPFNPPAPDQPTTSLGTCFVVEDLNFNATEYQDINLNSIFDDTGRL